MKKTYLASPYSHPNPVVREQRFQEACRAAARIIESGNICLSPIAHSHHVADYMGNHNDGAFWLKQCESFLVDWADEVWVLMIEGWERSNGIKMEVELAEKIGLPVKYI